MLIRHTSFIGGFIMGAGVLGLGILLGGMGQAEPGAITAREIAIVDELGTPVLVLGTNRDGGSISVRDRFGRTQILTAATPHGGAIVGNGVGAAGTQRAFELGVTEWGPEFALTHRDRVGSIRMRFDADGEANLTCYGREQQPRIRLRSDGHGWIETFGHEGQLAVSIGATPLAQGLLRTHGRSGQALVAITSTADDEGQVYTYGGNGSPLIALATHPAGPSLRVFNRHGEPIVSLESGDEDQGEIGVWRRDGSGRVLQP